MSNNRVDVIEVKIKAPHEIQIMADGRSPENAEAIIMMAIARRGVQDQIYTTAPCGLYRNGDHFQQKGTSP